jgi:hypothetical protein
MNELEMALMDITITNVDELSFTVFNKIIHLLLEHNLISFDAYGQLVGCYLEKGESHE